MSAFGKSRLEQQFLTRPIAHRGLHDAARGIIENSPAAVTAAVQAGYGIEIDVQISADGVPMVFHDYKLERLTGQGGAISAKSAAQLGQITLTGSNDTIPTLAQVLALVAGRVPLLIEIKDQDGALGRDVGPLERAVAAALVGYDGPLAAMSFNPFSVEAFQAAAPHVAAGLVSDPMQAADWPDVPAPWRDELARLDEADRLGVDFISHNVRDLGAGPVARLKSAGLPVLCWTVRDAQTEAAAYEVADNITFEGFAPNGP